jgi:hypothetical protein
MARKAEVTVPPRDDLIKLREAGKSRDEIAAYYNVSLSRVKRWIAFHNLPPCNAPRKAHTKARNKAERRHALGLEDGLTIIEKARIILGKRLTEDYRGYLIDGRPVRIDALAKAAGLDVPDSY